MRILIYGASGWIGNMMIKILEEQGHTLILSRSRLDKYNDIINELNQYQNITHCLLCAGITRDPKNINSNIDWCEDNKLVTLRANVIGTAVLVDECHKRNIHITYVATGCIYEYDEEHPIGGKGFTEEDEPNFEKSFYSSSKKIVEKIVKEFKNCLILRIRMPLSDRLEPRNFITKISKYEKVINVPNSMTILYDLLPIIPDMMTNKLNGIWNFCNPGVISHNEILDLYKEYIDPNFKYQNFTVDQQSKILKAGRSNNYLDVSKLLARYPQIPHIKDSIHYLFKRMKSNLSTS